jgi:hypothetical protein
MRVTPLALSTLAFVLVAGCAKKPEPAPAPASTAVPLRAERGGTILTERAENFGIGVAYGERTLSFEEQGEVASRAVGLVVIPSTLTVRVGDTLSLVRSLRVVAFDSAGAPLGRITGFDVRFLRGVARSVTPMDIVGDRPGHILLEVSYPTLPWGSRRGQKPSVSIPITVIARD